MANYYRILSAFSASGENLQIPIHWDFDKLSDISVVVAGSDGKASLCDYWSWNSQLNQIEIENTKNYAEWAAYVSRKEDASTLLQLVEGFVVNAQNIVEQFKKTNRVIEALQEDFKTSIRAPDYIGGILPNAAGRKGRFLSFDESGNPNCDIGTDEFNDASTSTHMAMAAAQEAAQGAQESFEKAAEAQEAAEISKSCAQAAQSAASQYAQNAQTSAAQASVSAEAAESAKTQSQGYAEEAETIVSDGLEAVQAARDSALQDIEVYTDPDGRISNLEEITSKVGRFYANGGMARRTFSTLGSVPFGFCFSYAKKTAWKNGDMPFNSGNISPSANVNGISMYIAGGLVNFYFEVRTKSALQTGSKLAIPYSKFPTDGKLHTVQFIVPSADVATWKAFVDGVDIAPESDRISGTFDGTFNLTEPLSFGGNGFLGNPLEVEFARIFIANYDMSASDAPYSVADYAAGKLPPPSVCDTSAEKRALLALDDYSIEVGSTKYIPDISGGANDFTVTGDFKGDKDISIKRLAALVAQSNA